MGVVMPGLSKRGGLVGLAPSPANSWLASWREVPIARRLSAATGLSVLADGDATAAAIGERLHGAARTMRDFLYVYIASGLGAGIVISGRPYRGRFGKAGELGHMVVVPGGLPCPCGNRGCLERYVSLSAAQARLTGRAEGSEPIDPNGLAAALEARDARLLAWLEEATRHLRTAIALLEDLFDPETIYIGGTLAARLLDEIFSRLEPLPRSVSTDHPVGPPRLTKASPGLETAALGAASLVFFESTSVDAQA
jgi:predicted NBD/HSP70 family sugar kinase